jgi:hypothetical protein
MAKTDQETLKAFIQRRWSQEPSEKAKRYIGKFIDPTRRGTVITAEVEGNYGIYTVSIHVDDQHLSSACSCYIGKHGYCHHCEAFAITFLKEVQQFKEIQQKQLQDVKTLEDVYAYLQGKTLEIFLNELKANGITQKAFAESIGMSTRHLAAIKSGELRNRYYHELGATKLACLWVLEHFSSPKNTTKDTSVKSKKAANKLTARGRGRNSVD